MGRRAAALHRGGQRGGIRFVGLRDTGARAVGDRQVPARRDAKFRTITEDTLAKVQAGDQSGATARVKDLETAWDDDQAALQPLDDTGWTVLDGQIDDVLTALRAANPDLATEKQALTTLLTSLR